MELYVAAKLEIVEFAEDVIAASIVRCWSNEKNHETTWYAEYSDGAVVELGDFDDIPDVCP